MFNPNPCFIAMAHVVLPGLVCAMMTMGLEDDRGLWDGELASVAGFQDEGTSPLDFSSVHCSAVCLVCVWLPIIVVPLWL